MGYYTNYTLEIQGPDEVKDHRCATCGQDLKTLRQLIDSIGDETVSEHYGLSVGDLTGGSADSMKWYEHEEEMRAFSKKYPNLLFVLSGEGEESGDIWTKYFKNGKMQSAKAKIEVEKFDPKKLA